MTMKRSVMMTMGKTTQPLMMPAEETIAWLESKCIRYELCDTPVPVSVSKVSCGVPSEIGDYMIRDHGVGSTDHFSALKIWMFENKFVSLPSHLKTIEPMEVHRESRMMCYTETSKSDQ